jgi:hypothetical protein
MKIEDVKKEIDRLGMELEKGQKMVNQLNQQIQQIILARAEKIGYLKALEENEKPISKPDEKIVKEKK